MNVDLRRATNEDCRSVWEWQQAPGIREYSGTKEPPAWESHQKWWSAKMQDQDSWFYIIEADGQSCGYLRFDKRDGVWYVSILVKKDMQRKGIGTKALKLAHGIARGCEYMAEINPLNFASIRIFEKAGYRKYEGNWRRG